MREALGRLQKDGVHVNYLRVRGFPFSAEIESFIDAHDEVYVVEQNRDAQLRGLLIGETNVEKSKLVPLLDYAGMPADPTFIYEGVKAHCLNAEA